MNEQFTPRNFIKNKIKDDLSKAKTTADKQVITRFPPEPNGFLHIGHAKSICLNFGIAQEFAGAHCNLRFDDTNPLNEKPKYIDAIVKDIEWLGYKWHGDIHFASDYFDQLFECAVRLIKMKKAYVCSLSAEDMKSYRGTLTTPGKESPDRERSTEDNLKLFRQMKNGDFSEGKYVLRAKIDMQSGNLNMRDPVLYRILKANHHRTGDTWCIYPTYDFTHCLSDSFENITHSLCTLEFQDHRPLYDWVLDELACDSHPQQIEFARLNINYTVCSKRKLKSLIEENIVSNWDDPRMPTLIGMKRRGYTSTAIRNFCERIGVSKKETIIDMSILEECVREDLNKKALRRMCVVDPIKVVITNYPSGQSEELNIPNHPKDEAMGTRKVCFSKEIYIERDDFVENPPKKFFRLSPGAEVRLRYAYIIKCEKVIKDTKGSVRELHCTYDPDTLGRKPEGRKVKGIIHWVSSEHSLSCDVRFYDRLFCSPDPTSSGKSFFDEINPQSLITNKNCYVEKSLLEGTISAQWFQFERLGYFVVDQDSTAERLIFNRTVSLKDTWAKLVQQDSLHIKS